MTVTHDAEQLIALATAAAKNAYAPYSRFLVGAAVLLDDGSVVTGANFENASYGLSLCAETVALATTSAQGNLRRVVAIAVAGGPDQDGTPQLGADPVTPCGRCRQILKECADLNGGDLPVHCAHSVGYTTHMLSDLLPHGFGPGILGPGTHRLG